MYVYCWCSIAKYDLGIVKEMWVLLTKYLLTYSVVILYALNN